VHRGLAQVGRVEVVGVVFDGRTRAALAPLGTLTLGLGVRVSIFLPVPLVQVPLSDSQLPVLLSFPGFPGFVSCRMVIRKSFPVLFSRTVLA